MLLVNGTEVVQPTRPDNPRKKPAKKVRERKLNS